MDPLTIGSVVLGGLWVLDKLGLKTKLQPPRQVDLNTCEIDPSGKYRVIKHQLRGHVQNACQGLVLNQIVQENQPIPGWYSLRPMQVQGETNAYVAIGEALKRGYWVALRLDSVHEPNGGVISIGSREETLKLCAGPHPFAILTRPREPQQPREPAKKTADPKQTTFDERASVIAAMMKAMPPEEREKLIAEMQRREQANGAYHGDSEEVKAEVVERPAAE